LRGCHSFDGSEKCRSRLQGLFGRREKLGGGGEVTIDENYIRESFSIPRQSLYLDSQGCDATFAGQLSEGEIMGVIEFIKSLK